MFVRELPVALPDFAGAHRLRMLEERSLVAVTFTDPSDPLREVDVLVSPPVDAADLVARSTPLDIGGVVVRVAAIDDLIAMKRAAGRAQDVDDVAHLERLRAKDLP